MAYDSARGVTILFGGFDFFVGPVDDTWEWDGNNWTPRSNSGPPPRSRHAMAYDSARGVMVLFGGQDNNSGYLGDTWEWDGTAWTLAAGGGPSPRSEHAMAYDGAREVTVLSGHDTWEFGGTCHAAVGDDTCQTVGADTGLPCGTDADCTPPAVCGNKCRYLSITTAGGGNTSIQVEIVSMPQFPGRVGGIWWAGAEQSVPNSPNPNLRGAPLTCSPTPTNAQVWTTGVLHLFGTAVVPGSTYNVRMCDAAGAICSDPLLVATGKWGDVVRGFGGGSQPNFGDVNAIVQKFGNLASAPSMPRADLVGPQAPGTPNTPNQVANFADISNDVSAFSGFPYPFTVSTCP